jgi:hypothetical protein
MCGDRFAFRHWLRFGGDPVTSPSDQHKSKNSALILISCEAKPEFPDVIVTEFDMAVLHAGGARLPAILRD